ncbi:glycine cleavage system H protein [Strigomonas culicis]|uniref:Glycine cleavage system H protein n=1 Tax=Strigomonas culicis TaxID=28005 RepID=S9W7G3_9TRYP|nr:glycine cleavage system H protein [Strigomonas culicis]EPY32748.1 glycine cleavage system H protein [Strigomonas culicis]|eukprot:EPY31940.1 glycine cleavage system H protein [Strigomonas culicis]
MMRKLFSSSAVSAGVALRMYATRLYTDSHEWIEEANGEVTIGISTYAQENLGDVVFVSLPLVGEKVTVKDVLGEVESVKATSNVYSPVAGTVTAINEALKDEPGLINQSPEEKGWMVKVKHSELPKGLMSEEEYKKFLE